MPGQVSIHRQTNTSRANGHVDNVGIAQAHDGKWTEIVENEMHTLPLWKDIERIGSCSVAFDGKFRWARLISIEKENMRVEK
jgi:hypothetical protein